MIKVFGSSTKLGYSFAASICVLCSASRVTMADVTEDETYLPMRCHGEDSKEVVGRWVPCTPKDITIHRVAGTARSSVRNEVFRVEFEPETSHGAPMSMHLCGRYLHFHLPENSQGVDYHRQIMLDKYYPFPADPAQRQVNHIVDDGGSVAYDNTLGNLEWRRPGDHARLTRQQAKQRKEEAIEQTRHDVTSRLVAKVLERRRNKERSRSPLK